MINGYKIMRVGINTNPYILLALPDKLKDIANNYMPVDTGLEIECNRLDSHNKDAFRKINNIVEYDYDSCEDKVRIPSGIKGMICLYDICEQLKLNCSLNPASGIHYHIDMTKLYKDVYDNIRSFEWRDLIKDNNNWILQSLKSWGYNGSYNTWVCGTSLDAVRYHKYHRTLEIRIGEMTFDYELIIKRILHCHNIVKKLKILIYNEMYKQWSKREYRRNVTP